LRVERCFCTSPRCRRRSCVSEVVSTGALYASPCKHIAMLLAAMWRRCQCQLHGCHGVAGAIGAGLLARQRACFNSATASYSCVTYCKGECHTLITIPTLPSHTALGVSTGKPLCCGLKAAAQASDAYHYAAQNRSMTQSVYETLPRSSNLPIQSVNAWVHKKGPTPPSLQGSCDEVQC
jgi:hypothetical protein